MQINSLSILQFRGIQNASLRFKSGFNLIVGVNGAGKSSVLDALCVVLARALPELTPSGAYGIGLSTKDITVNRESLAISSEFTCHGNDFSITLIEQRTSSNEAVNKDRGLKDIRDVEDLPTMRRHERPEAGDIRLEGTLRGQTTFKPDANVLTPTPHQKLKKLPSQPLVLYLSVRRSIPNERTPSTRKSAAYQSIFSVERGLEVRTLASWWIAREALAAEAPESKSSLQLAAVKSALQELLPSLSGWRVAGQQIFVSKTAIVSGITDAGKALLREEIRELPLAGLSDGEKSLVAITTDIAQRLVSLNPDDSNPIKSGKGIVLLDEIDLHLHPSWQREIAAKLPLVFPGLQFIATTHSPQVIGETEPGRAIVLYEGGETRVLGESLGRDSGWILRHIMGTTERNATLQAGLDEIDKLIEADEFKSAREQIKSLRARFGDDVELVGAEAALDRWETLGREEDN